jgi:hypothetical protein
MTKTYWEEDYLPMKKRKADKSFKHMMKDIKTFIKNEKGWGMRKRVQTYTNQRQQEHNDIAWDNMIDSFMYIYIPYSLSETGKGVISYKMDNDGNVNEYNLGDTERGWRKTKERAYEAYMLTHINCVESKENVLKDILKEIEKRVPLYLKLIQEKPRTRGIPAKVRYAVYMRDEGKCVYCGSNVNIEFDHIIPFSKGGSHSKDNIRVLCQTCNRKRSNKIEKF